MAVQAVVYNAKDRGDRERQNNEIHSEDRIRHKGVKRLIRKIVCIIQGVTALLGGRKTRKEHKRRRMKQKDRLIRIGRPSKPHHRRPDYTAKARPTLQAVSISRLRVALWN